MRTSTDPRPRRLGRLALLACALVAGCASAPELPEPAAVVEVRALIYSGRQNPSVVLDEAEIAELAGAVGELEPNRAFEGESVTPSILGYAGIIVINGDGSSGLPGHLAVYGGNVEVSGAERAILVDRDGMLEEWLIERLVEGKALQDLELDTIRGR